MDQPTTEDDNQISLDQYGDPVADPRSVRMIEADSMERVIEGLKMAADGAAHLAVHEYQAKNTGACNLYSRLFRHLDQVRLVAVEIAADDTTMKQRETEDVRRQPMRYKLARQRLRDGLKQASGGMRQIATCHRGDVRWSNIAQVLDDMLAKINMQHSLSLGRNPGLILH